MRPIASADIRRFMASPEGSLLAEISSRYAFEREKLHIDSVLQFCIDTIRLLRLTDGV